MRLPDEVRDAALARVYEVFDRKRWEQVPASKRGAVYDELIADEGFTAALRPFATPAQMRVWLKDSAAKEYPRALEGTGPTASYTKRGYPGPTAIVAATLGDEWAVVANSIEQKPMRCRVTSLGGHEALLTWGPLRSLRDLYFAASAAKVDGQERVFIAITRPTMAEPPKGEWDRVCAFCDLIGVEVFSVMYAPRFEPGHSDQKRCATKITSIH
ncbi:hypothetical protein AXK56_03960 [Tsukamurella pulmonis]|uniref:Uncharacterized protein n=1 Tax=Tsukamurella pulmonis TaxID=47312 RepID=A0A1H1DQA6_9ACTN|nr:hypothetical protein [Tsukamurella pulmonis]KXO92242.1 hypothetical protein AXK56_03960 [Tsukamurella pulmonis]SDQ78617.1 hypothetical protein SAMN04489765_1837 [Tsukamurella pulmonis]SUP21812.1 Uncharacterised protein [Tsukamurella pulmonis]